MYISPKGREFQGKLENKILTEELSKKIQAGARLFTGMQEVYLIESTDNGM